MIADTDIRQNVEFDVLKGQARLPLELGKIAEPGAHVLVTLSRAIDEGTGAFTPVSDGSNLG